MDNTFVTVILIDRRHKPIDCINLLGLKQRLNVFTVKYEQTHKFYLNKRQEL
jgi:hypothetical protein